MRWRLGGGVTTGEKRNVEVVGCVTVPLRDIRYPRGEPLIWRVDSDSGQIKNTGRQLLRDRGESEREAG